MSILVSNKSLSGNKKLNHGSYPVIKSLIALGHKVPLTARCLRNKQDDFFIHRARKQ